MSEQTPRLTNTSDAAHCPHCGVCHTADETCIQSLKRVLALYENRQPSSGTGGTGGTALQPVTGADAVREYMAYLKTNLQTMEVCPSCNGSNDPCAQFDCENVPCKIGRDFHQPPLNEVIEQIEALLTPKAPAGHELYPPTFIDLIEKAEAEISRLALNHGVAIEQLFPSGLRLSKASLTLRALTHASNSRL